MPNPAPFDVADLRSKRSNDTIPHEDWERRRPMGTLPEFDELPGTPLAKLNLRRIPLTGNHEPPRATLPPREERFRVHLMVRYQVAGEFIREYSENLSRGGLFVRGAHSLKMDSLVRIHIELPGLGTCEVDARVVHIVDPETAFKTDRFPGAGMSLEPTPEATEMLWKYLSLLGRRKRFFVMVRDARWAEALDEAGYQITDVPPVADIESMLAIQERVAGVVVPRAERETYLEAAERLGTQRLVHCADFTEELPDLLAALDLNME